MTNLPNLDPNASGAAVPTRPDKSGGQMSNDMIRDNQAVEPNLGLSAAIPDVTFMGGDISPADFQRGPLVAGQERRSPGDGGGDPGHRAFFEADKAAEVEEASLGPGILPTPAVGETYGPIRASDFVRGDIGTANSSSGLVRRAPLSADDPLFTGGRERGDFLQEDGQPSPMAGKPFPDTAGRQGAGDYAQHQVVKPQIDVAPSLGADATGIGKAEFAKKVE